MDNTKISKQEKLKKIFEIISKHDVSNYEISQNTGISEAGLGSITNKETKNPRDLTVNAIYEYLISKYESSKRTYNKTPRISDTDKGVPYYDVDFIGGFDLLVNDQTVNPTYYIDFQPYNDADCWINVTGKSMGPLIAHGDIIALKEVPEWKRFLLEGEIYAIVTDNGFRTVKIIGKGPDKDHFMLIPYNKSEEYAPQEIPKDVIVKIFRVKGSIKKFF